MPTQELNSLNLNQEEVSSATFLNCSSNGTSLTNEMRKFYANHAEKLKSNIDTLGAEVHQRQDKMRLINEIISEINNLTDEKNGLDISKSTELLEKLKVARDLGVKIKEGQLTFNAIERDRLVENLHLASDNWDKENRNQTQKMEIVIKELDRLMMILKDVQRKEDQSTQQMLRGIRGG